MAAALFPIFQLNAASSLTLKYACVATDVQHQAAKSSSKMSPSDCADFPNCGALQPNQDIAGIGVS